MGSTEIPQPQAAIQLVSNESLISVCFFSRPTATFPPQMHSQAVSKTDVCFYRNRDFWLAPGPRRLRLQVFLI